jgi:hypothetical protein
MLLFDQFYELCYSVLKYAQAKLYSLASSQLASSSSQLPLTCLRLRAAVCSEYRTLPLCCACQQNACQQNCSGTALSLKSLNTVPFANMRVSGRISDHDASKPTFKIEHQSPIVGI